MNAQATQPFDFSAVAPSQDDKLDQIVQLAKSIQILEGEIATLTSQMAAKAEKLKNLQTIELPELIMTTGLSEIKLSTGETVSIQKFYSAKIPEDKIEEAYEWLRENNHDGIIKNEVTCSFGKGDDKKAKLAVQILRDNGFSQAVAEATIHAMTLKSFVKEQCENPDITATFPRELFGVFEGNIAKLKPAPKSKKK